METQFCRVGKIKPKTSIKNKNLNQQKTSTMKTFQTRTVGFASAVLMLFLSVTMHAQVKEWNPDLENEAQIALNSVLEKKPKLESFKNESYGYAVFPKITKAAIGIGGALGNGVVYRKGVAVGSAHLKQATYGIQFGGQQYVEIIFFENQEIFEKFTNGKLKFDAQASAVALKAGASFDVAYQNGVAVVTATKGGLMYEASIGGQHFKYRSKQSL